MSGALSVRKTLVLGLGSTGLDICEQLAEHLTWQFGGFERAAWVRLLVLETAQPRSPLGDRVLWGGMRKEEYLPYRASPRTTGAEFGFYEWQDGPTLQDIDSPADGAGNCRMLGRLCLFHPRTYANLRRRLTEDMSALEQLTPQGVADRLGESGLTVNIHNEGTVVYVVGTLCGGTCSGGAGDLGYLLDVWTGNASRRQAIFTVPHPTLAGPLAARYRKNAFYALRELNHYQLADTSWVQTLPGSDRPYVYNTRPYDILRVVMPGGAGADDVRNLNAMIAQYLAAAVGPAGFEIAASDVDATGKMVGAESIGFMRPLFSTLGVAALEYPGEHIQRAATSRLLAASYGRWTAFSSESDAFAAALEQVGGAELEAVLRRLTEGTESVAAEPVRQAFGGLADGESPTVDDVRRLLRDLDARLTSQAPPGKDAPPTLAQVIEKNQARLMQQAPANVTRLLDRSLLDLEGGPGLCAAAVRQFLSSVEGWSTATSDVLAAGGQDSRTKRDILDRQIDEVERGQKGFGWGKREKLRRGWQELLPRIESYLAAETRTQSLNHIQRRDSLRAVAEQYRRVTAVVLRRLDQVQAAFLQETTEQERRWKPLAASSPSVNGKVYFDAEPPAARGTVTEEYYALLRQPRWPDEPATGWDDGRKELAAMRSVAEALAPLREELAREDGQSAFDSRPATQTARESIPRGVLAAAEERARAFFAPLREQTHIADKAGPADLAGVVQASEPRLGVSAAQVSDQLAGVKGAVPMESYFAFMDLPPTESQPREAIARVIELVRNSVQLRRGTINDSGDPYRLLLLREKHGFTLGQMQGVVRTGPYDHHALQAAEGCMDFKFWHTRRDVDWVDPLVPPAQVEATEEAWLMAVLLGRPADKGLAWLPATKGEIAPEGWYQVVSGEFYVYHAGELEASEKGCTLPRSFNTAVARLLTPSFALLRRTLSMRFNTYAGSCGHARVVSAVDTAVRSLATLGVTEVDATRADRIVRRAYRRNDALTRAFFDMKTRGVDPSEFAHIRRSAGTPIEGSGSGTYQADGYYCPQGHHWLGAEMQKLLEGQFRCPVCNTEERYWP
ncbi:MAG: hypothetical protein IT208_12915 [Chthonomonadales bacterium]|nr:hypothetical protein [Chthonomonadales bacterium]